MKKHKAFLIILGIILLAPSSFLRAEDEDRVELTGNFELGYRYVDISGNADKYYEDVNIRKGPRLLSLNFDILPSGKYKNYFDLLNIHASTIGGDPFESYGFTLKKHGYFNFRYGHRKTTYFYKDIILPPSLADRGTASGGDFHHFNFVRNIDDLYLDIRFSKRAKFFVAFDRQQRLGESTTSLDIGRDEFEFDKPVDELKTEYKAGLQVNLDKIDFYFEGSYRDYENHARLFLPGYSAGADAQNVDYPTVLNFFDLMTPYEFTMPMFTAKVSTRPTNRIKATLAYTYSDLDMEMDYSETALGVDYTGVPLDYTDTGNADISRNFNLVDFDFSFRAHDKIYLIGGFRYNKLDQQGDLDIEGTTYESKVDIETSIYEAGAHVLPYKTLALTGGIRYESRDTLLEVDTTGEEKTTKRTTFFINANYTLTNKFSILGEYERGTFDNPFTLMSPTDLNKFKIRAKIKPVTGLNLTLSYMRRDLDNDDTEGKFDSNTIGLDVGYNLTKKLYASAGYSWQKIETSITNILTHVLPFPPFQVVNTWNILYESKNNMLRGSLKYAISKNFSAGVMAYYYKNSGSWELSWATLKSWLKYTLDSGYSLFLSYKWNDYDEELYDFDDYSSNIFTVGFGYKF